MGWAVARGDAGREFTTRVSIRCGFTALCPPKPIKMDLRVPSLIENPSTTSLSYRSGLRRSCDYYALC
jgi:hypothetical protein